MLFEDLLVSMNGLLAWPVVVGLQAGNQLTQLLVHLWGGKSLVTEVVVVVEVDPGVLVLPARSSVSFDDVGVSTTAIRWVVLIGIDPQKATHTRPLRDIQLGGHHLACNSVVVLGSLPLLIW